MDIFSVRKLLNRRLGWRAGPEWTGRKLVMASSDPWRPCWMPLSVHQAAGFALCLETFAASRKSSQGWAILLWCLPLQSDIFETYHFYDLDNILAKWNRKFKVYCSTVWRFLSKLKIELWYNGAIPLLGIYLEKTIVWKDTCTPVFITALFTIAKTYKKPKLFIDR